MHQARYGTFTRGSLLLLISCALTACTVMPPPPLVHPTTSTPSPTTTRAPSPIEVDVGVSDLGSGFNPHALADLSPTTSALASMTLPSVFQGGPGGTPRLDTTLMSSAGVVPGASQFTVRYQIRREAEWSDGTPIAAEDFVYLWQQLISQPGVADPAGYRLISNITSEQGGKTVLVTFSRPYPGWRSLFTNLLPAHLLRDAPAGWGQALNSGYPASGGPFEIAQVDRARGVITLERNDRYWGAPAVSDRIVLRASNQAGQVAALASGSSNLAMFTANASTMARLRAIGKTVRLSTLPQPVTTQLLLRPSSSQLSDVRVRQAVAAALDRNALVNAGTGGGPGARLQDQALTLAPSQPGYVPTMPSALAAPNPASVKRLLTAAGYQFVGGAWVRDGRSLGLVIAAPFERQNYVNIANAAAQQLDQQGIQATVVTPTSDQLFNQMLSPNSSAAGTGQVSPDMVVTPGLVGGDPAATLAASYGCPGVTPGQNPEPPNPAGFCDELLQPTLEAALSGQISFRQESARVEPFLWSQAVALPLYQQSATVAVRQGVTGVQFGPGFTGPFFSAAQWHGLPNNNAGY